MMKNETQTPRCRRGVIVPLTALMMVFMLILVALAIDTGYMLVARTELQESADAAALAAAVELVDNEALVGKPDLTDEIGLARSLAVQYAALNKVRNAPPVVDPNSSNSTSGDVVIGYLANPSDQSQVIDTTQMQQANAVQVTVRRTASQNGEVGLFFSRIFGKDSQAIQATATAAIMKSFSGFKTPDDGSNLPLLPIALKVDYWNDMLAGKGPDQLSWDPDKGMVGHKGDNILEINLYPESTTSPGNVGTVDIGTGDNSTSDIARQILDGVTPADIAALPNGDLAFNSNGELSLNGDTGISASIQKQLWDIRGQPRMIPLYKSVVGPGDNATYTIVAFVGIRILDVDLTGNKINKRVTIQAANVQTKGGIGGNGGVGGNGGNSTYVNSYVWLVR